jgi:aarF domain-containing kinase
VILDAGIANSLTAVHRRNFVDTFYNFITKDGASLSRDMITRSRDPSRCKDPEGFSRDMQLLINDIHRTGIDPTVLSISQVMRRVFGLCYKYQVKLESSYAGVLIAVSIMEGLIRQLDPSLDILTRATPYIFRAALKR